MILAQWLLRKTHKKEKEEENESEKIKTRSNDG
jgi:hypothetical protein